MGDSEDKKKFSALSFLFKKDINTGISTTEDDLIVPTQSRENLNIARYFRKDPSLKILDQIFTVLNLQYKIFFNNNSFKLHKEYKSIKPKLVKRLFNIKVNYQPNKKGVFELQEFYKCFLDTQKLRHKNIYCMTDEQVDGLSDKNAYIQFIVNKIENKTFYNFISINRKIVHIDNLIREKGKIEKEKFSTPIIRIYEYEYNIYYVFSFSTFMRENKINQSIESKIFSEFSEPCNTSFILQENIIMPINDHDCERVIADMDELIDGSYALNTNTLYNLSNDGEVFFYEGLKFFN